MFDTTLSLFDGIGGAFVALEGIGFKGQYFSSEIAAKPASVLKSHCPDAVQLGDVSKISAKQLPRINFLVGGSPCQDLSLANSARTGLEGEKSKLFYEFVRLKNEIKPDYFLLENVVPSNKKDMRKMSALMGVLPILIDSALFTAQRRKRLYWTNIPAMPPAVSPDLFSCANIAPCLDVLGDVLQKNVANKYYISDKLNETYRLLKPGQCWRHLPKGHPERVAGGSRKSPGGNTGFWKISRLDRKSPTLLASGMRSKISRFVFMDGEGDRPRYPTPRECEALQGLPFGYTASLGDNDAYHAIGNGFTIQVIKYILNQI